jgi:hypothetical protein
MNILNSIMKLAFNKVAAVEVKNPKTMPVYSAWLNTNKLKDTKANSTAYGNLGGAVTAENKGMKISEKFWGGIYNDTTSMVWWAL